VAQPTTPENETRNDASPVPPALDASQLERAMFEVKRVIVGQDRMVERMFVALLARGHCLLEGVPGVAKTLAVETLAKVVGGTFSRIQFTPDLVPADIVGTRIYRQSSEKFDVELGPVFVNFLLADEINRAPAKVQSALLEVMQERQVTIGRDTLPVPDPFLVLATQNPIESEGTYPLPEAQLDRFMFKVVIDYPSDREEIAVVDRSLADPARIEQVLSPELLGAYQRCAQQVFVDRQVNEYAVALVSATRQPAEYGVEEIAPYIEYGASPRGSINLVHGGRALALLRGRNYVIPEDVRALAFDVLRHRLVLTYEALADGLGADDVLRKVLDAVPLPAIALSRVEAA
jgi:MoxR-like ATPase